MSRVNDPAFTKYKFRDLKVYTSTEWLADNRKKYRQVFDRYETSYIYAELSFYNKLFDEDDWDAQINLKCFSVKNGRKEICDLAFERKISRFDNVVFIREGWGNKKEGVFWKRGTYYWEAFINGLKVSTRYFYIEDSGKVTYKENPYFEVKNLRIYESPYDDVPPAQRVYCRTLSQEETRYVFAEIQLQNLQANRGWHLELFVKFVNGARELKGQAVKLHRVEKDEETIELTANWGSNIKGSWREDRYQVEVVFMDVLVASTPFEVGQEFVFGTSGFSTPLNPIPVLPVETQEDPFTFDQVMAELDLLIGLHQVKKKIREHAQYIKFLKLRRDKGFVESEEINIHSVFIGNPGTGKTTVAKMMGRLYKKMGLLSKGHVHEVDRVDLIGEYIGQTAPKVKDAIERARGGILFIDEAYALARSSDDTKDFGREVIEILIKEMSDGVGDLAVIVAGYPKEMKYFLSSNPGLKSRFKLFYEFSDYLPQDLAIIAEFACQKKKVVLSPTAKQLIQEIITEAYRNRDRSFGNARFVYDLIEQAKLYLGLRIMAKDNPQRLSGEEISIIELEDVQKIDPQRSKILPSIPIDYNLLQDAMAELDRLIGMNNIKREIQEMVSLVRYYRESNRDVLNKFYLHSVLVGNPGTGKTTVARILSKIYKALGILERGHVVETDRQGLVAGYVGQTAIKTAERIEEAMGGVLFIDEAYALTQGSAGNLSPGDFGNEAIQTLLKRMEDRRGEFFVFVAGYPENMETFLKANPGLRSRFDKVYKFEDYTTAELYEIAAMMLKAEELQPTPEAELALRQHLSSLHEYRDKYFGNARTVRQLVLDAVKHQGLRLASIPLEARTEEDIRTLLPEDIEAARSNKEASLFDKKTIGFRGRANG